MEKKEFPIKIYELSDKKIKIDVHVDNETIRLNQEQIWLLFGVGRQAITKHIKNIYETKELIGKLTCSKMELVQIEGWKEKKRSVLFYNLDMIISIWYRVNSKQATQFRIWATDILKQHIVKWYTVNQKRLQEIWFDELDNSVKMIKDLIKTQSLTHDEAMWMLHVITQYTQSWILLNRFDSNNLEQKSKNTELLYRLESENAYKAISELKKDLLSRNETTDLFALERKKWNLDNIFWNIYQWFDWEDLYPTLEEKAVHLLYFVVKNHPFTDGNKRSWAFLFVLFLAKNWLLYSESWERKINDQTLVALTLLIARSDDKDKELMIKLSINLLLMS